MGDTTKVSLCAGAGVRAGTQGRQALNPPLILHDNYHQHIWNSYINLKLMWIENNANTFTKFYNILITCLMSNFVTSDEIPILLEKKILVARTLTLITAGSRLI